MKERNRRRLVNALHLIGPVLVGFGLVTASEWVAGWPLAFNAIVAAADTAIDFRRTQGFDDA